ncbi:hypothetical protein HDU81_007893 [Chytriomyces hyalinus]|nr:hypothetical protein HDU81_007893 [Chytriomyces hyalinus]
MEQPSYVPVTVNSSALITDCRPLPEDIATLDDCDTGCEYCGVSYLLLSKYNRIVAHVSKLEKELETLKTYAVDHPLLLASHAALEQSFKESKDANSSLAADLAHQKDECGQAIRGMHELQLRYTRLTHDYETLITRNTWMDDSLKSQIRSFVRSLAFWKDDVTSLKEQLLNLKNAYVEEWRPAFEDVIANASMEITAAVPAMIETQVQVKVSKIAALTKEKMLSMEEEIVDLKDEISESQCAQLSEHLQEATRQFDECLNSQKTESENTRARVEEEIKSLKATIQDLEHRLECLQSQKLEMEQALNHERALSLSTTASMKCLLQEKESELRALNTSFENERKAMEQGGNTAVGKINRALAQKDVEIHKLNGTITELKSSIEKMKEERGLTIEAHQSRIKQLQDKYQEMLKEAGDKKSDVKGNAFESELRSKFEAEKIELLTVQKGNFQKQLSELQAKLQSQIDAARITRDHTVSDSKRKLSKLEEESQQKLDKLKSENDQLKTRIVALELKAAEPQQVPVNPAEDLHTGKLASEISRRDAEIAFLKETIKMECEERMQLMTRLDSVQRGVGLKQPPQRNAQKAESCEEAPHTKERLEQALSTVNHEPAPTAYQKLMAMAAVKKGAKLKQAAKKNQI